MNSVPGLLVDSHVDSELPAGPLACRQQLQQVLQQLSTCQQELAACRAERDVLAQQLAAARGEPFAEPAAAGSAAGTAAAGAAAPSQPCPAPAPASALLHQGQLGQQHNQQQPNQAQENRQQHNPNNQHNHHNHHNHQGSPEAQGDSDVLVTDFLPNTEPIQCSMEAVRDVAEARGLDVAVWVFSAMQPGETLQQHVQAHLLHGQCPGPHMQESAKYFSSVKLRALSVTVEVASRNSSVMWANASTFIREWQALVKTLAAGNYDPVVSRGVIFGEPGKSLSSPKSFVNWPAVITDEQGQRYWGMVRQVLDSSAAYQSVWGLRDLLTIKNTPSCVTVVAQESGGMLWQNAASMHMFGSHGLFNSSARLTHQGASKAHVVAASSAAAQSTHSLAGCNFMQLLFGGDVEQLARLEASMQTGGTYRAQVPITNPRLRAWMGLRQGEDATHDVQVSLTRDPLTLQKVYCVSQIDISATVAAQREVQAANARLAEEKLRTDALVQRQYNLITCLGRVSDIQRAHSSPNASTHELINAVRRKLTSSAAAKGAGAGGGAADEDDIELLEVLGVGSFGKVYKATWRGTIVAVKTLLLPSDMSGSEKRQRMALMEAAISSTLSHPNILQTYTYSLQPVENLMSTQPSLSPTSSSRDHASGGSSQLAPSDGLTVVGESDQRSFEVRLVIEFCDMGTLRDALNRRMFVGNLRAVLATAIDIACGMAHLHSLNIVHSDLKALNVLLRSNASDQRGLTAKIADFGLSVKMDAQETHLSRLFQGTPSHMAPETMLHGKQSHASDVYAFGITLWELWTGDVPFRGIPHALLGHRVVHEGWRPQFPPDTLPAYAELAHRCWAADAADRPTFDEALKHLQAMARPDQPVSLPAGPQDLVIPSESDAVDATLTSISAQAYEFHDDTAALRPAGGEAGAAPAEVTADLLAHLVVAEIGQEE